MPIPLVVPLAIGLGLSFNEMLGQRKAKEKKTAENQTDLDRLAVLMQGGSLAPGQAGPPTPAALASGFTPREQQQLGIVAAGTDGGANALALAEKFAVDRGQAAQQKFANETATADLQLRMQSNKLAGKRFGLDLETFLFEKGATAKASADAQRSLVDPEFAAKEAADAVNAGTGDGSFSVFQPARESYGTAWLAGTAAFEAAETRLEGTTDTLNDMTEMREMIRLVDVTGDIGNLSTRRIQSITTSLQLKFKDLAGLGVISETDFEAFILRQVPDATTVKEALVSNPQAVDQALVQFTEEILRANADALGDVESWPTITDEQRALAVQASKKAQAQQQVAARELGTEVEEQRRRQLIQEQTGVGATSADEQFLANSAIARFVTGDTGEAAKRLERARQLGADPGLVPEGVMGVLSGGLIDAGDDILRFIAAIGGGRIAAGGARPR